MAAIQRSHSEHSAAIARVADRQDEHTAAIEELGQRTTKLESTMAQTHDDVAKLADRVKALEAGSRPGSSVPSSTSSATGLDPRRVDRSILRVSVRGMAARDAVEAAIRPLLAGAQVRAADVRLDGSAVARSFVLRVLPSSPKPAEDVVRSILDSRRLPSGGWRDIHVRSPGGESLPLFVDPDRSVAQRRIGWYLSTTTKAFAALHPSLEITAAKAESALTHKWEPVVRFTFNAADNSVVPTWETKIIDKLGIDLEAVKNELAKRVAESDAERRRRRG